MTNIIQKLLKVDFRKSMIEVAQRFPISLGLIILVSILWFIVVNASPDEETIFRLILTWSVVFFLSTALALLTEREVQKWIRWGARIFVVLFAVFFYFSIDGIWEDTMEDVTFIILCFSGFFASLFTAPFLVRFFTKKSENPVHYSNYFIQISWTLLMGFIVGGALIALGGAAIGSVYALFDLSDIISWSKVWGNWAVVALVIMAPLYALAILPHARDYETESYIENRFFSFMVRYIAVPFIFVYFLILYAYSAKVLMNFSDWPKGMISWMVIGFSSFGYLIYIFSRAYESSSSTIALFRKYFPYLVLPQILMLGYAIGLRIMQYDVTMNRYFVVVFGLWLTVISLYYVFSRTRTLSYIPVSLTLAILIVSIWPWSVYSVSQIRQESRLIRNLETANIMQDGKIVPLIDKKDISRELSNDIYSGIEYLCGFDDCQSIKDIFPEQYAALLAQDKKEWNERMLKQKDADEKYSEPSRWTIVQEITDVIKVERTYSYNNEAVRKYLQYNNYKESYPLAITWYDRIVSVYDSGYEYKNIESDEASYEYISLDPDTQTFSYYRGDDILWQGSLPEKSELTSSLAWREVSADDLEFNVSNDEYDIRLRLQNYAILNPDYTESDDEYDYFSITGIALIRDVK